MDKEMVLECLDYDEALGLMTWRTRPKNHFESEREWKAFNTRFAGRAAGNKSCHRYTIGIKGKTYLANRLAAIYMGYQVEKNTTVICLDGDTFNIKKENLFVADRRITAVMREAFKDKPDKCIYQRPNGKYQVAIGVEGRNLYGGVFDTMDDARGARDEFFGMIYGVNNICDWGEISMIKAIKAVDTVSVKG